MVLLNNVCLSEKTTFRIGGTAANYYIPETIDELLSIITNIDQYMIISGGSNLLINDNRTFSNVISMEKVDLSFSDLEDGLFYVGASVRIQELIRKVNKLGYGGFEELIGLPALFGGILYMNAGIGNRKKNLFNISDFVVRVKCIDKKRNSIVWISGDDCKYSYRSSLFMNDEHIILGAEIKCKAGSQNVFSDRIKQRKEYCKKTQEWNRGCFGSCFSQYDKKILKILRFASSPFLKGITVSKSNPNWITNNGKATFKEMNRYINCCKSIHKLFRKNIAVEVRVWD